MNDDSKAGTKKAVKKKTRKKGAAKKKTLSRKDGPGTQRFRDELMAIKTIELPEGANIYKFVNAELRPVKSIVFF